MAREKKTPGEKKRAGAGGILTGDFEERAEHEKTVDEKAGKPKHLDFNIDYQNSVVVGLTGSSNNFELAIAVAAAIFGISSKVTLATVIGPLIEVPIMLALVRIGLRTRKYFPRKKATSTERMTEPLALPEEA